MHTKFCRKTSRERDHLEDLEVEGMIMIILKWILNKYSVQVWTGFYWFRIGPSGDGLL
jgi:hypothetical protein